MPAPNDAVPKSRCPISSAAPRPTTRRCAPANSVSASARAGPASASRRRACAAARRRGAGARAPAEAIRAVSETGQDRSRDAEEQEQDLRVERVAGGRCPAPRPRLSPTIPAPASRLSRLCARAVISVRTRRSGCRQIVREPSTWIWVWMSSGRAAITAPSTRANVGLREQQHVVRRRGGLRARQRADLLEQRVGVRQVDDPADRHPWAGGRPAARRRRSSPGATCRLEAVCWASSTPFRRSRQQPQLTRERRPRSRAGSPSTRAAPVVCAVPWAVAVRPGTGVNRDRSVPALDRGTCGPGRARRRASDAGLDLHLPVDGDAGDRALGHLRVRRRQEGPDRRDQGHADGDTERGGEIRAGRWVMSPRSQVSATMRLACAVGELAVVDLPALGQPLRDAGSWVEIRSAAPLRRRWPR